MDYVREEKAVAGLQARADAGQQLTPAETAALEKSKARMAELVAAEWIDVCENGGQRPGRGEMLDGASAKA